MPLGVPVEAPERERRRRFLLRPDDAPPSEDEPSDAPSEEDEEDEADEAEPEPDAAAASSTGRPLRVRLRLRPDRRLRPAPPSAPPAEEELEAALPAGSRLTGAASTSRPFASGGMPRSW